MAKRKRYTMLYAKERHALDRLRIVDLGYDKVSDLLESVATALEIGKTNNGLIPI